MAKYKDERDELDEEDDSYSIKEAINDILRRMKKCDETSEEYEKLTKRLVELEDARKNKNSWMGQALIQGGLGLINTGLSYFMNRRTVKDVLVHEDRGNILTPKSTSFIKKPNDDRLEFRNLSNNSMTNRKKNDK